MNGRTLLADIPSRIENSPIRRTPRKMLLHAGTHVYEASLANARVALGYLELGA